MRKAQKAHLGSLVGWATAHSAFSTHAAIETADKYYTNCLLKTKPGEPLDIDPFFKMLKDKQRELDVLHEKEKPTGQSTTEKTNGAGVPTKSSLGPKNVSSTRNESWRQVTGLNRSPVGIRSGRKPPDLSKYPPESLKESPKKTGRNIGTSPLNTKSCSSATFVLRK